MEPPRLLTENLGVTVIAWPLALMLVGVLVVGVLNCGKRVLVGIILATESGDVLSFRPIAVFQISEHVKSDVRRVLIGRDSKESIDHLIEGTQISAEAFS